MTKVSKIITVCITYKSLNRLEKKYVLFYYEVHTSIGKCDQIKFVEII